jgi:hypothetical protein
VGIYEGNKSSWRLLDKNDLNVKFAIFNKSLFASSYGLLQLDHNKFVRVFKTNNIYQSNEVTEFKNHLFIAGDGVVMTN